MMNTQNILQNYGSGIDLVLDSSEYYDYELGNNTKDYVINTFVITDSINYLLTVDKHRLKV